MMPGSSAELPTLPYPILPCPHAPRPPRPGSSTELPPYRTLSCPHVPRPPRPGSSTQPLPAAPPLACAHNSGTAPISGTASPHAAAAAKKSSGTGAASRRASPVTGCRSSRTTACRAWREMQGSGFTPGSRPRSSVTPYSSSPSSACPAAAPCSRIWWVRPVCGEAARRQAELPCSAWGARAGSKNWPAGGRGGAGRGSGGHWRFEA